MGLKEVLAGIAVVLAVEGLLYAIAPGAMRRAVGRLAEQPDGVLRIGGLVAATLAVGLAWLLVKGMGR
jgi:uncharacterized protein YjeT (DUF2065 family)